MNFSQSFEEFSSSLGPMDLALYAGVGIVLWVLFKDKLSPVQKIIVDLVNKAKSSLGQDGKPTVSVPLPDSMKNAPVKTQNVFFDLVVSWKQTRDLAELSGCKKAVEVADQMFPYLSPTICSEDKDAE
tara:strand:- start:8230 stop:8613 length:384 start_codon:yes stop_codon:yes gene_type:complete